MQRRCPSGLLAGPIVRVDIHNQSIQTSGGRQLPTQLPERRLKSQDPCQAGSESLRIMDLLLQHWQKMRLLDDFHPIA